MKFTELILMEGPSDNGNLETYSSRDGTGTRPRAGSLSLENIHFHHKNAN